MGDTRAQLTDRRQLLRLEEVRLRRFLRPWLLRPCA